MPRTPNSTSDADNALPTKMKLLAYRDVEWTEEIDNAIGTESDSIIGHRFGISPRSITVRRRRLGKLVFRASPTDLKWSKSMDRQLGTMPDTELAKRLNIDVYWIRHRRQELGVAAHVIPETPTSTKKKNRLNLTPGRIASLGKSSDTFLAKRWGVTPGSVGRARQKLGIEPHTDGFELNWKTVSQSAILDQDFDPSNGTLMLKGSANESVRLDVITLSDEVVELDETLGLQISTRFPLGIADRVSVTSLATGTIKNDDTTSLSVRNITVTEGDSGNRNVAFEVTTGTNSVDVPFTVTLGASDLTATNNVDFVAATSVLSFSGQSGQTQSYVVSIVGDSSVEIDEQFVVNALSVSASGRQASINVSAGIGTIINDDGPRIVVLSRGAKETDSGEFTMTFDVTLTSPLGHPVSVTASTWAGSAVAGVDYVANSGTLLFSGLSNQTLPFYVTIKGDTLEELDEQFEVNLSDLQASGDLYSLANGTGTIYNDDKIGFTVVVPSSIAPIPGSKPHIVAATSDLANAPPLLIQLTGASGDLPFGATLELMRVGTAEPLFHQQITFQSGNGFSTLFTLPVFAAENEPEFISILLSDVHEIANGYGGGGGGNTRGNHSWAVQVEPTRTKNAPVCEGLLPIDDYRNTGTFEGIFEPLPVYVYWVNEQTASGALGGHWVAANGEHPPGPGLWDGITYSNNLEDIPDTTNAIKGDLGFGRDKYGYAVVPSTNGNENFLIGSVQRQNAGNLDVFLKRKAGKSELKNGPGKCSFPEVPPVEVPPIEIISDIHADWVIPFTESFTFNPFPSFNYRLTPSAGLTVRLAGGGFAQVGASVPLRFGTVVVNPDDTLTYTPASNLTSRTGSEALQPERDSFGNIIRFTGIDQFESHIVERSAMDPSTQSSPSNIYGPMQLTFASTPVVLAVANTLPTTKGSFSRTNAPSTLDSLVFADMNTSYSLDLKDLFLDADGAMDVSKLRVIDIEYMNEQLDASKNTAFDPHPTQIRIPIGNRPGTIEVLDPNMGIPIVNLGPRAENSLVVSSIVNTSIIEIENTVTQQIEDSTFPSRIELTVKVTDGQKEKFLNAQNQTVSRDHIIELVIAIRPRVRESSGLWRIQTGIPDIDVSPWVKSQTPPLSDRYDAATQITKDIPFKLNATSSTLKATDKSLIVADTDANLFSGSIHRRQELILDGSGGDSELSLPGLIYSSSYVPASSVAKQTDNLVFASFTKPVGMEVTSLSFQLTWYDYAENVTQIVPTSITVPASKLQQWLENTVNEPIVVALQPGRVPKQTGVYPWQVKTTVGYKDGTVSKTAILYANGETPVVVIDDKGPFGPGWVMEDVPILVYDRRPSPSGGDSSDPLDDRLMLIFPGQTPRLFNAASLAVTNGNFNGQLPNIDVGSEGISYDGARAADEFGTLESTSDSQFLTYTAADNVKYVFERYVWGGKKQYAISRIEPAGLAYNEADWNGNTKRRGISFTWEPESNYNSALPVPRKGLTLTASDGKTTTFDYLTSDQVRSIGRVSSLYNLSYTLSSQLNKIEIVRDPTRTDSREFTYDNDFHLKTDKWFSFGGSQTRLDYLTTYDYATNGFLNKVTVGDTQAGYDVTPAAQFAMGAIGLGKLVGRVEQTVIDLEKYDAINPDQGLSIGSTTNRTDYRFSPNGLLQEHSEFINPVGESPQPRTSEKWDYNAYGSLARYTDPLGRKTIYWYDYQKPAGKQENADGSVADQHDETLYDQDDYRGNVIIVAAPMGFTRYFYETADIQGAAVGQLVHAQANPKIDGSGNPQNGGPEFQLDTYYGYRKDGQRVYSQTVRGKRDAYPTQPNDPFPVPTEDSNLADVVEQFGYDTNGFLNKHIGPDGLVTNYTYINRHLSSQSNSFGSTLATTTVYVYDAYGFIDKVTIKNSSNNDIRIGDFDYDSVGNLVHKTIKAIRYAASSNDVAGSVLLDVVSDDSYQYDTLGNVILHTDGNATTSRFAFNRAGQLINQIIAEGATYLAKYTGTAINLQQTTNFVYYSDGSIKNQTVSGSSGSNTNMYYDPANGKSWNVLAGVSSGDHQFTNAASQTTVDAFGRVTEALNLLTGAKTNYEYTDIRVDLPTKIKERVNLGWNGSWTIGDHILDLRYDADGNVLSSIENDRRQSTSKFDLLGRPTKINTIGIGAAPAHGSEFTFETDAAGRVISQLETRSSAFSTQFITATTLFDVTKAGASVNDPLTGVESGTSPANTESSFDGLLTKVISTDRTGLVTTNWFNSIGQLMQSRSPLGAETYFEYDLVGQLTSQLLKPDTQLLKPDTLPTKRNSFVYDKLGRLRSTTEIGFLPPVAGAASSENLVQSSFTDYFGPNDAWADGWSVVQFATRATTDPLLGVKFVSTRIKSDALGNPIYIQQPDPDYLSDGTVPTWNNNTPTILFTYNYDANNLLLATTTRLSMAANSTAFGPIVDVNYASTRVSRSASNTLGLPLFSAVRMSGLNGSDSVVDPSLLDAGFVIQSCNTLDLFGNILTSEVPVGTGSDPNGDLQTTTNVFDDLGRLTQQTLPGGKYTEYQYDSAGNLIRSQDSLGQWTKTSFDALSRPLASRSLARGLSGPDSIDDVVAEWTYQGLSTIYKNRNGWETTTTANPTTRSITEVTQAPSTSTPEQYTKTTKLRSDGSFDSADDNWTSTLPMHSGFVSHLDAFYDALGRASGSKSDFAFDEFTQAVTAPANRIKSPRISTFATLPGDGQPSTSGLRLDAPQNYTDSLPTEPIFTNSTIVDSLGRTILETQTFNSASSGNWAGNSTPRQKRVLYTYNVDSIATVSRSEFDGGFQHFVDASYGYFADGRAMSVSYNTSEFSPSINTTIHHTATVNQSFYSNGQLASVSRTAVHDSANLKKIDELIKFAYNANGQLQSQTTSYVPPPNSTVRQPGPTSTRDPKFDTTPGGRIADDNQFTYKYDKEGNLIERVSKFSPITIDDLDSSVYATTTSWFSSQAGNIPISTTAPSQRYSGGGLGNIVTATVDFPQVDEGVYDVWTTWKSSTSLGSGTYELFVQDDFTRANTPPGGFGWGMLRDESTGLFRRTTNSSDHTYVPVDFRVDPRDTHDDGVEGLRWFSVGTVQVDSQSKLSLRLQKDTGQVAIDGFRLTPHVRREVIEYDQANRPTHSLLYSERASTARTETYYAYDVTGKMVAVRNRDLAEDSKSTLGFAYQGNQQLLSFSLDTYSGGVNEYGKIKSFNLLGTQGEVLGIDSSRFGQPAAVSSLQQTVWQINNLDGTRFTDTNGWFATNYAFAGQKLASTNTDYLTQSRDAHRNTWSDNAPSFWSAQSLWESFNSELWQTGSYKVAADAWNSLSPETTARIGGGLQLGYGLAQAGASIAAGIASCPVTLGVGCAAGIAGAFIGVDNAIAGFETLRTGKTAETLLNMEVAATARQFMSEQNAQRLATGVELVAGLGVGVGDDLVRATSKFTKAPKGGFTSIGGGPSGASFANGSKLLDEVLSVAQSSKFIDRAKRLGFSDELIQSLPNRIRQYGDRIGEIPTGGWADASQFLIGRRSLLSSKQQRIAHELGHVLDDLSQPGLFQRAGQAGFGFKGFYKAERVAYMMQYGRNPVPLTLFNAGMQSHPYTTTAIVGGFIVGGYLFSDYVFN